MTTSWSLMASSGGTPARIMPVMAPGSATSPTTLVLSTMGNMPARMALLIHGRAASRAVRPSDRWASTSRRSTPKPSRNEVITMDAATMALDSTMEPSGITARASAGMMPSSTSTPTVAPAATAMAMAATPVAPGTPRARLPLVHAAEPTITVKATRVSRPWPSNTNSST
jgi:hypothetical protein